LDYVEAAFFPYYWSQNGNYLYLGIHQASDGGFGGFYNGSGLYKLDLRNGEMIEIIPEEFMSRISFMISPDETKLVYSIQNKEPRRIKIKDLANGSERILQLDKRYASAGAFAWSLTGDNLVFMVVQITEDEQREFAYNYSYSFNQLNPITMEMKTILEGFDRWLKFSRWTDGNLLYFTDWDDDTWLLDLSSNSLVLEATATPIP